MTTAPTVIPAGWAPWWRLSLSNQILLGLALGCAVGALWPSLSPSLVIARDVFLHLIKCLIAPLVFASVVQGIAGTGDLKRIGRIGAKSLLYFEVVTTAALAVGLLVVNVLRPGAGVILTGNSGGLPLPVGAKPLTLGETILHSFPTSVVDAMARGDVLQIVVFAVIFALAVVAAGDAGKPVLSMCQSVTQVMFSFAGIVMRFAPIGVGAAMAVTVSRQGLAVLADLGQLVLTLYLALVIFVVVVLGLVIRIARIPLKPFVRAVREPFTIAFATANSEAALPKAFAAMERFGVPKGVVSFVMPAGYTFNLDGSTLYLAVASVFVAQAAEATTGVHFSLGQQIAMMLTLMLTSKGVAAVPRAALVVLIAALQSFGLPLEGAALILGVDALLDMARTSINVLGNCLASVVVARWEGQFDETKARAEFGG